MLSCFKQGTKWLSVLALFGLGAGCADVGATAETVEGESAVLAQTVAATSQSSIDIPVKLRGTGSATIRAVITENNKIAQGATLLDIHGLGTTGRVFDGLTRALFDDAQQGARVKRVVTIDMVGHGGSSFPTGLPRGINFGSLNINDNVSVIQQAIEALRARGTPPQMLVGHSMGALQITALQQTLLSQGSSLSKIGVSLVLLIAPIPSHGRPWAQPAAASADAFQKYIVIDSVKGIYLSVPADIWIQSSFTDRANKLVATAPTPAQVIAAGYVAPEPALTLTQLTETTYPGVPKTDRPTVSAGAFAAANATRLAVVGFSEDVLVSKEDARAFYEHLTGDTTGKSYLDIVFPDAVHNMTISNPDRVINAMRVLFP